MVAMLHTPSGNLTHIALGVQVVMLPKALFIRAVSSAVSGSESAWRPMDIKRNFQEYFDEGS